MHDIFLSHAHEDMDRVRPIVNALRDEGFDVWWDGDIKPGERWQEIIEKELSAARCVLICWSRAALRDNRDWVRGEAERARGRSAAISVLLEPVNVPTPFNMLQSVSLENWENDRTDANFRRMNEGIRSMLENAASQSSPDSVAPSSGRRTKRALLIGVGNYSADAGFESLPAAKRDIDGLEKMLRSPACGFDVKKLCDPDLTTLESEIEGFFPGAGKDDTLVFYYTGHAFMANDKSLHLTAQNSVPAKYRSTALSLTSLAQKYINQSPAAQVLILFDACYRDVDAKQITDALHSCFGTIRSMVVFASGPGAGPERWRDQQSPLTEQILAALATDEVDRNKDEVVTAAELIQHVTENPGQYMDKESGRAFKNPAPISFDFHGSPEQMELRGRGTIDTEPTDSERRFINKLAPELDHGLIPFLGDGIYGKEPLSFKCVAEALADKAGLPVQEGVSVGLATAAETLALQRDNREVFLCELRDILANQAAACKPPAAHDLILDLKPPWLVLSVNYDDLLERRLAEAGKPYVLVCHVLRSGAGIEGQEPNKHAGKILVVRNRGSHGKESAGANPDPRPEVELCASDKLVLQKTDCVLYKLLGSPFLNKIPFVEEQELDPVVITESDHIDFLVHLRRDSTSVPNAIVTLLKKRKLLFLEYNLDIWHYRLISHVFRVGGTSEGSEGGIPLKIPYSVRKSASPLEDHFWTKLFKPDEISMDITKLVRALHAKRSQTQ